MGFLRFILLALLPSFVLAAPTETTWSIREWSAREGLPGTVTAITQATDGMLWVGTRNGVARFDGEHFTTLRVQDGLADPAITALAASADGRIWIGTLEGGLALWQHQQLQLFRTRDGLLSDAITTIHCESPDTVWVGTRRGLCRMTGNQIVADQPPHSSGISVTALHPGPNGMIVELADETLWTRVSNSWTRIPAEQRPSPPGIPLIPGLELEPPSAFFHGRNGTLWAGFRERGLLRLTPSRFHTLRLPVPASTTITCLTESPAGELWAATSQDGLFRISSTSLTHAESIDTVGSGNISSLLTTPQDGQWAAKDDWLIHWPPPQQPAISFSMGTGIQVLTQSPDGTILAGLSDGRVAHVLFPPGEAGPTFVTLDQDPKNREITALATSPNGTLWIGSFGHLQLITPASPAVTRTTIEGFPKSAVSSILPNPDGSAWIGTRGHGLVLIDSDHSATTFSTRQGFPTDSITQLTRDSQGLLWLACQPGLICLDPSQENTLRNHATPRSPILVLTRADGLPQEDCTSALTALRDGRIAVGSGNAIALTQPSPPTASPLSPTPLLDTAEADGIPLNLSHPSLVLEPGTRNLTLHFTSPLPELSEKIHFRSRLLPLEPEWQETTTSRQILYSRLPPGSYQFELCAGLPGSTWNPQITTLSLELKPHFWQTWWWRTLLVITALSLLIASAAQIIRRKTRILTAQREREQAVEQERVRIASDLHDSLGAGLTQIGLFIELATHDHSSQQEQHLRKAFTIARQSARSLDQIVWAVNPLNDSLDRTLSYLGRFSEELLSSSGIHCHLELPVDTGNATLTGLQRHHLYLALREALHNVIRHAAASRVTLHVTLDTPDSLLVILTDNGHGFTHPPSAPPGNGLLNLQRRMHSLNGTATITTTPGQGTTVMLSLPLHSIHLP